MSILRHYLGLPPGEAGERSETDEGHLFTLIRPAGTFPRGKAKYELLPRVIQKRGNPHQRGVPVNGDFVGRVRLNVIQVTLGRWQAHQVSRV